MHPALTERERAGIDIDVSLDRGEAYGTPLPTLEQSAAWARSVNPLLRRRAARDPRLPADLAAALADDSDPEVRRRLAHHHPAAPPALLLRAFREHPGGGCDYLPLLPRFPRAGLARFADDEDPGVRRLTALDPAAPPEVVERLLGDPDESVRQAMARCPRLPLRRLAALLEDEGLAEPAAANPALPPARMAALLSRWCRPCRSA